MGNQKGAWRRATPVALATLGVGAVVYASAHPSPWVWHPPVWDFAPVPLPVPSLPPQSTPLPGNTAPQATFHGLDWLGPTLAAIALAVLLFFVGRWVFRLVKELASTRLARVPPADRIDAGLPVDGPSLTPQEVTDAVQEALRRLDAAPTPTDAVIAAWLALEEAAARHDLARDPAQTPTEFTAGLLDRSTVPAADTIELRTLYLRARFSSIPPNVADVFQARTSLEHIARELEAHV